MNHRPSNTPSTIIVFQFPVDIAWIDKKNKSASLSELKSEKKAKKNVQTNTENVK